MAPGETGTALLEVVNTGTTVEMYRVSVCGEAHRWATVEPELVRLFPQQTALARIAFALPVSGGPPAGDLPVGIRVASTTDPRCAVVEEGVLPVEGRTEVTVEIRPHQARARTRARQRVLVSNQGNVPARVRIEPDDPDERLEFTTTPPTVVVPPGHVAAVVLRARLPRGSLLRRGEHLSYRVTADYGSARVDTSTSVRQLPIVPRFVLALAGLALVAAGLALATSDSKLESGAQIFVPAATAAPTTVAPSPNETTVAATTVPEASTTVAVEPPPSTTAAAPAGTAAAPEATGTTVHTDEPAEPSPEDPATPAEPGTDTAPEGQPAPSPSPGAQTPTDSTQGQTTPDPPAVLWYIDGDGDGWGGATTKQAGQQPAGYVSRNGDCDDSDQSTYPGSSEPVDGIDHNCDGKARHYRNTVSLSAGSAHIVDDESWPFSDEVGDYTFAASPVPFSNAGESHPLTARSWCVGDEVVVSLGVSASLSAPGGSVRVTGSIQLYEQTNCSPSDLDGQANIDFSVAAGSSSTFVRTVQNSDEGGDSATIRFTVGNTVSVVEY